MWISVSRADDILADDSEARAEVWSALTDSDKGAFIGRASNRLELVPFVTDDITQPDGTYSVRAHGRFVAGFVPDANGAIITTQRIPVVLATACALLARWYADNPDADLEFLSGGLNQDSLIADLPLEVRSAVWPYLIEEAKPGALREVTQPDLSGRPAALPLVYVA